MNGTTTLNRWYAAAIDRPALNATPAAVALVALAAAAVYLDVAVSGRQSLLFLVGAFAGIVLYHAAFGFTSAWRDFLIHGRGAGIRAQMLMLALTCVVFFPLLAAGHAGGQALRGSVSPIGVSVVVGAFMFGVGMQLGGGCASGTLYTSGGGNTRMLATLAAFIAGSLIATRACVLLERPARREADVARSRSPADGEASRSASRCSRRSRRHRSRSSARPRPR